MSIQPADSAVGLALGGDYPLCWQDFIGQDKAKRMLRVAATSAKARESRLDHVLLRSSIPGIGKTGLALLTAMEMGRHVEVVSGKMALQDARVKLSAMADGDILYIDEARRLVQRGKANSEWLLHYLQDGILLGTLGPEEVPKVTVIGSTTDAGRLPEPLLQRFATQPELVRYADLERAMIAIALAGRVLLPLPLPTTRWHGRSPGGQQPAAAHTRTAVFHPDLVTVAELEADSDYDLTEVLAWMGLTPDGLTPSCQRYLVVLLTEFRGQAGLRPIADRICEGGHLEGMRTGATSYAYDVDDNDNMRTETTSRRFAWNHGVQL